MFAAANDPTLAVHGWSAAVLLLGGLAAALVAIFGFTVKIMLPLATTVADMRKDYPVWVEIAQKFGSSGGETLSTKLQALAANDEVSSANQRAMMAQLETVIAQAKSLDAKLTETRHGIIGKVTELQMIDAGARTLVDAIVKTSEDLQAVRAELALLQQPLTPEEP